MRWQSLLRRGLWHHRHTNLAVVAGVAVTVSVLTGALLVGDSVTGSLQSLIDERVGSTDYLIISDNFFPDDLANRLIAVQDGEGGYSAAPMIALQGFVTHESSRRRAASVQVYGVDSRFWEFHGLHTPDANAPDPLWLSPALADEFGAEPGDSILVRVQRQTEIPLESLHARRDQVGRSMRFELDRTLPADELGEFSLRPQQGLVRAVFVPLERIQRDLEQGGRVNTILVDAGQASAAGPGGQDKLEQRLRSAVTLQDLGLRVRQAGQGVVSLESDSLLLSDNHAEAARRAAEADGLESAGVYAYLANTIRAGSRAIPYSLVVATDAVPLDPPQTGDESAPPRIWLNRWAWDDLWARPGQRVTLEYFLWDESGRLMADSAEFELAGQTNTLGFSVDAGMAPEYPGITDADTVGDWDPPFPIDLKRVRSRDEEYWTRYRATPKAVISLAAGQKLWRSRFGRLTSLRLSGTALDSPANVAETFSDALREAIDPLASGFSIFAVRAQGDRASAGAVNFGEYFFYFSFFIVVSAVMLTGLFFRLGVEQRVREIGLLQAVGYRANQVARLFLLEGLLLATVGSSLGILGALGYGALMMYGLRTWWVEAVGTTLLELHIQPLTLIAGFIGGISIALLSIFAAVRGLRRVTTRNLLAGSMASWTDFGARTRRRKMLAWVSGGLALVLVAMAWAGFLHEVAGFFGSGILAMVSLLTFQGGWLATRRRGGLGGHGFIGLARLGVRNASWRPGRSLLGISLIASATFIVVAVDAFRHDDSVPEMAADSGTGGYTLLAESMLPIPYDLDSDSSRRELSFAEPDIAGLAQVRATGFRLRPGDDTSCLNLYQPQNPKILGVPESFVRQGRFGFRDSLARTQAQKENPWLLLEDELDDGAIPVAADAHSLTYVLHRKLGEEFVLQRHSGEQIRLRMVAALDDSIFQGELLMAEKHFLRLFPNQQGFRFFLIDAPLQDSSAAAGVLEGALADFAFDVEATGDRLAVFHRVENTYLSTFQALGGLGLLLGTLGLAAVLLRNVLERRRELAQLRAMGYQPRDLVITVLVENSLLLAGGLATGVVSALLAIAPALWARGGAVSAVSLGVLVLLVMLTGLGSSLLAVTAVVRTPLLPALRTE